MENSQSQLEREVSIAGSPHFVIERNKGEFYVVKSAILKVIKKGTEKSLSPFELFQKFLYSTEEHSWIYKYDIGNDRELKEGLDIREYTNRGIKILVELSDEHPFPKIIDTLRDFAYIGGYDYFSIQGNVINMGDNNYRVTPRIFRKIVDN